MYQTYKKYNLRSFENIPLGNCWSLFDFKSLQEKKPQSVIREKNKTTVLSWTKMNSCILKQLPVQGKGPLWEILDSVQRQSLPVIHVIQEVSNIIGS